MSEIKTGIVLEKTLKGESGVIFKIFSREDGIVFVYKRISKKKTADLADYFDEVSIQTQKAKMGDMLFASEFEVLKSRIELAKDYEAFECASKLAIYCIKNSAYLENFEYLYDNLIAALNALMLGANKTACELKFMYLFARNEGYAIKENFFINLDLSEQKIFREILLTASKDLKLPESQTLPILNKMLLWISENTDICVWQNKK